MDNTDSVSIEAILPLLEGSKIFQTDFTTLLRILSKESTVSKCSKSDLNHLCSRALNYLKSNEVAYRWIGSKLALVLCSHPAVLVSSHCLNFINALIKVLESKCFISDIKSTNPRALITLESCVKTLDFLINHIRGKPSLTREVLTPKLPAIIGSLIELITIIPDASIDLLYQLLLKNSTTFRPFGAKFEKKLMLLINESDENFLKLNKSLQSKICNSLCLLSFCLAKLNASEIWSEKVSQLIQEIKSVVSIYCELLDVSNDSDFQTLLSKIPDSDGKTNIFPGLDININERPFDVLKITRRLSVLIKLLNSYLVTPTANVVVKFPLGYYLVISDLLTSLNVKFMPIKREIRDAELTSLISFSLKVCNKLGLDILDELPATFKGDMVPYISSILATFDSLIPIKRVNGKITVDQEKVFDNQDFFIYMISITIKYLKLINLFNDMSVLSKIVEVGLILTQNDTNTLKNINNNTTNGSSSSGSSSSKKNTKSNSNTISMADILSHQNLFVLKPNSKTLKTLRRFFNQLFISVQLPSSKITDIQRYLLLDSFTHKSNLMSKENEGLLELIHAALLLPGYSSNATSILPILSTLVGGQDKLMSVLGNPRFPVLPTRVDVQEALSYSGIEEREEYEEEEMEEDAAENMEQDNKQALTEEKEELTQKKRKAEEDEEEIPVFKKPTTDAPSLANFKAEELVENYIPAPVEQVIIEKTITETTSVVPAVDVNVEVEAGDDDDSDFEIPEIDIGSDDEEEDADN